MGQLSFTFMQTVAFHTLGCKLNFTETASLARQFASRGYHVVDIDKPADVIVLNTCSVTERADRECRQFVRRALRTSPGAYVIVVGCYAQLRPDVLSSISGVDLVLGTKEKFEIFSHAKWQKTSDAQVRVSPIREAVDVLPSSSAGYADRTRAFLKIQDGCDYTCSFCTIPLARGSSRSIALSHLLTEARSIVAEGYKEIVLTGVNVGDYGKNIGSSLVEALKAIAEIEGLERLRVSSVEPNLLSDDLLEFWTGSPTLCKHFHIPLQSGADATLAGMRRRYRRSWYADRLAAIRKRAPLAGIGADVIVGFPGETKAHFEETYAFLVEQPLTYLHVFTYSERPNTPAASFGGKIPPELKAERSERLRMLSRKKRHIFHESLKGKTLDVLFEESGERETGLSDEYVRVSVASARRLTNQILPVVITESGDEECYGSLQEDSNPQANLRPIPLEADV
ncbi:MAG: tRNA (N(6)-L-threonylcarbamoyladenosine(37)-C(2))-methylthiotransferase MtaB [Bacteroidota bacterium]